MLAGRGGPGAPLLPRLHQTEGAGSVRIRRADDKAYVTIKGEREGIARSEYEYEIPVPDAEEILETLCEPSLVQKTRYCVKHDGMDWEVDVFERPDRLVMAEIELKSADQNITLPAWAGREVT